MRTAEPKLQPDRAASMALDPVAFTFHGIFAYDITAVFIYMCFPD